MNRAGRNFRFAAITLFVILSATIGFAQDKVAAPTTPSAASPKAPNQTSSGPLGDFIPCLFNSDELYDMHAIQRPPGVNAPVDIGTVYRVIRTTKAALVEVTAEAFKTALSGRASTASNANAVASQIAAKTGQIYADDLEQDSYALVGMTQDQLLLKVSDAATNALLKATAPYSETEKSSFPDLTDVQTAASASIGEALTAAVSPASIKAPTDVSCSMAILTWQETSDTFGRRVANTYIAIQVTVRNLNKTNEFLIHDIQVAVDTGMDPDSFYRFTAGRDKLLVRAVAQRGQSEDRRNLALHSLEAVGAIASAASLLGPASEFATAVAVFNGAFIPAYSSLFPDHTVEQLNHINDLVFSASSVNKVIVPIQGAVPLVTFISAKPAEQLPFAWCGYTQKTHTFLGHTNQQECEVGNSVNHPKDFGYVSDYSLPAPKSDKGYQKPLQASPWDPLDYKKWKPAALRILQDRTFVVIGGVHIKQLTNEPGKVGSLSCPTLPTGSIDISMAKDGLVVCSVIGTNLDSVLSANLEKGTEKIAGKSFKPAKDGNSADLQLDPAALSDGAGIYKLMLIDKSSNEVDSGESVKLEIQPLITSADSTLDLAKPAIAIKGKHLDKLQSVLLVADDGSITIGKLAAPAADGTSISISFPTSLTSGKQYFIRYEATGSINQVDLKSVVVKVTGTAPASPTPKPGKQPANVKPTVGKPGSPKSKAATAPN